VFEKYFKTRSQWILNDTLLMKCCLNRTDPALRMLSTTSPIDDQGFFQRSLGFGEPCGCLL